MPVPSRLVNRPSTAPVAINVSLTVTTSPAETSKISACEKSRVPKAYWLSWSTSKLTRYRPGGTWRVKPPSSSVTVKPDGPPSTSVACTPAPSTGPPGWSLSVPVRSEEGRSWSLTTTVSPGPTEKISASRKSKVTNAYWVGP